MLHGGLEETLLNMPVSNLQTRATCGAFYFVFQNYMQRRVHKAVEARTFVVTLGWPLSVARTVVIGSVFVLALCHTAVNSPSACPARGDNAAKENFAYVLESKGPVVQPVERLLSTVRTPGSCRGDEHCKHKTGTL